MRSFAKVNTNNIVEDIISCDEHGLPDFIEGNYIESTEETKRASISGTYDQVNNKFIDKKPYESWTLNSEFDWEAPFVKPEGFHRWDEGTLSWVALVSA